MIQLINDIISDIVYSNLYFTKDFYIKIEDFEYLLKYNNYIE